jgi:hypothetical protein
MMLVLLKSALLVLSATGAQASMPAPWITSFRKGVDSGGNSLSERIEIRSDGSVQWNAASIGRPLSGGCAPGGGSFEGNLSAGEAREFASWVRAALKSQPKPSGYGSGASGPRSAERLLELIEGENVQAGLILRASPALGNLDARLSDLKSRLRPQAAVAIRVLPGKNAGEWRARFVAPGDTPLSLAFPSDPNEVFGLEGYRLQYVGKAPRALISLGGTRGPSAVELPLKGTRIPGLKAGKVLSYSTALVRHHERTVPELYLCTETP